MLLRKLGSAKCAVFVYFFHVVLGKFGTTPRFSPRGGRHAGNGESGGENLCGEFPAGRKADEKRAFPRGEGGKGGGRGATLNIGKD